MGDNIENTVNFGVHFMVDAYGASKETLKNKELLTSLLSEVPERMGMHTISEPLVVEVGPKNRKDPGGLSGFVMIAESHFSFHTFPERRFVTMDVYTCQDDMDTDKLLEELRAVFKFTSEETHYVRRGTKYPAENIE